MPRVLLILSLLVSAAHAQTVSYFRLPTYPTGIAAAPDGTLWLNFRNSIQQINTLGEALAGYDLPRPSTGSITAGSGAIWFARQGGIDSIDLRAGSITAHDTGVDPYALTIGADGNIWFAYVDGIGRMTPAGATTLFPIQPAEPHPDETVLDVTAGPDGNIWFADYFSCGLRSMTPSGDVTCLQDYLGALRVLSAHDELWLTRLNRNTVTQLTTAGATIATYEGPHINSIGGTTPSEGRPTYPRDLAAGPDGRIWFGTENPVIGSLTPGGAVTFVDTPPAVYGFTDVVAGPDGNVWAALEPILYSCVSPPPCPAPDPTPPIALARVNLVNPAPRVKTVDRHNPTRMTFYGAGFVPDTVIRWNGVDRTTVYASPFEVALSASDSELAAKQGGTFVVHNAAPGGGDSAPYVLPTPRRHAAH